MLLAAQRHDHKPPGTHTPKVSGGAETLSGVLVVIDDEDVESPSAQLKPGFLGFQGSPGVHELVCPLAWCSLADHLPGKCSRVLCQDSG